MTQHVECCPRHANDRSMQHDSKYAAHSLPWSKLIGKVCAWHGTQLACIQSWDKSFHRHLVVDWLEHAMCHVSSCSKDYSHPDSYNRVTYST